MSPCAYISISFMCYVSGIKISYLLVNSCLLKNLQYIEEKHILLGVYANFLQDIILTWKHEMM